ncbi:hypothetical protein JCM10207_007731 [Rhodosporidiobolus poonsookiae]
MPSLHDTRLLSNLLKTEKDAMQAFKHYTLTAQSAGAALSAWSVADSADTGDIMDAALRISTLLSTCTDAQRTYLHALSSYRASLKDVLARESALRTVVRDREILVNRLIKIGNKRPKDSGVEEHAAKLEDAQRELRACETYLQEEEAALAHAKRQSFRDALAARMRSMGELAHVMEESANEAVEMLEQLGQSEFDEAVFKHSHHQQYDLASDAGDSIAPSQSASQAMSRASSSSSLSDLGRAPPLPTNLQIGPSSRSRTRSLSPAPRAGPPAQPASAPAPAQPALSVPSAPPPVSDKVYAERQPGLPSFDIPRAPDLSRRPADSDSESDYGDDASGVQAVQRSSHYPLDSPPQQHDRPNRLSRYQPSQPAPRRAMSDTSSVHGGGRKRRGSFLGGIAALFRRGGKKDDRERERRAVSEDNYLSNPALEGGSYAGARSRLASSAGGGGNAGVHDAVRRSVMNAGRRREDVSSDDDAPRNVVRHVNDPKARIKAMSDVGRSSSPAPAVARAEKRPTLQRKGTSQSRASTLRPLSVAGPVEEEKPKKRKVKKAASDIGVTTSGGWHSTEPPTLAVPKAPAINGLPPLAPPPPLSVASPSTPTLSGTVTPRPAAGGDPETASASGKKKKSKKSVKEPQQTVILSAEALGIPTASYAASPTLPPSNGAGLSRSGTVKTVASTATADTATNGGGGTLKKKKKARAPSFSAVQEEPPRALPTASDLASSLPTARQSASPLTAQLPRPDDNLYASTGSRHSTAPAPAQSQAQSQDKPTTSKAVKTLQDKKSKRLSALHGVGEGNWVSHPQPNGAASSPAPVKQPVRTDVHEGDESLLSVVDRAEGADTVKPSRQYGAASPSVPLSASLPTAPPAQSALLAADDTLPLPPTLQPPTPRTGTPEPTLTKRKSVRLGDATDAHLPVPGPGAGGLSPSGSIRSASSAGQAKRGILIQRDPSPVPGSAAASLPSSASATGSLDGVGGPGAWPSRSSILAQVAQDSSDESSGDEGRKAYRQARKLLGKKSGGLDDALAGKRKEKGKGRAGEA